MTLSPINSTGASNSRNSPEQIRKIAQEFESIFNSLMLKSMRGSMGDNPLIPTSLGEKIYTGMLDDEYAKTMSEHASFGLSDLIVKELERKMEQSSTPIEQLKSLRFDPWMIDERLIGKHMPKDALTTNKPNAANLATRIRKWDDLITRAANDHGVDKNLVAAIVAQESGGNQNAVSPKGAKGLMQLMDSTAADMGVSAPFAPWQNISAGTKYFKQLLDRFGGNEQLALASYNAGPGAVQKHRGIPPYRETQNYVTSVLHLKRAFTALSSRESL